MSGWVVPYRARGSTLGSAELEALQRLFAGEASLSCGAERDAFEEEFRAVVGAEHAVALTNCTVALEFATFLIGLRPGDEVIAVSQTYHATVQPLVDKDVRVLFCEIDPTTLNVDVDHLESLVTDRTRAVYVVHHGGRCIDLDALGAVAARHDLRVVEDCAHALPATSGGRHAGTLDIGCFSFQSYKNISTLGEGGMLTVRSAEEDGRARAARAIEPVAAYLPRALRPQYEIADRRVYWHHRDSFDRDCASIEWAGTNSTLAEPACAVGRVQLTRLGELTARRADIAARYDAGLGDLPGVELLSTPDPRDDHAHHLYTFRLTSGRAARDALLTSLVDAGIEIQQRYFPVHLMPEWRLRSGETTLPVTERVWFDEQVQLPIYPQLPDDHVDHVIDAVGLALGGRVAGHRVGR